MWSEVLFEKRRGEEREEFEGRLREIAFAWSVFKGDKRKKHTNGVESNEMGLISKTWRINVEMFVIKMFIFIIW